ncbi:unnamed protein product, partial [Sphacelaria rigidula]
LRWAHSKKDRSMLPGFTIVSPRLQAKAHVEREEEERRLAEEKKKEGERQQRQKDEAEAEASAKKDRERVKTRDDAARRDKAHVTSARTAAQAASKGKKRAVAPPVSKKPSK